ncbi:hypothetical protein SAQ01S_30920 [Sphingomonas aquatilis NBRC 16722]|nr:hypothetical protein SAQ01S_30920 [Sphingomonas aquatilis NBRC 16722]
MGGERSDQAGEQDAAGGAKAGTEAVAELGAGEDRAEGGHWARVSGGGVGAAILSPFPSVTPDLFRGPLCGEGKG